MGIVLNVYFLFLMSKSMKTPNNQSEIHAGHEWYCMLLMSCDV